MSLTFESVVFKKDDYSPSSRWTLYNQLRYLGENRTNSSKEARILPHTVFGLQLCYQILHEIPACWLSCKIHSCQFPQSCEPTPLNKFLSTYKYPVDSISLEMKTNLSNYSKQNDVASLWVPSYKNKSLCLWNYFIQKWSHI